MQAIVVSVLAVIVVVTLLKPEDSGLLSGVTTPGAPESVLPSSGSNTPRTGDRSGRDGREQGPAEPQGQVGTDVVPDAAATVPAPAVGTPPSAGGGAEPGDEGDHDGEGSPSDDQYADTLTRITERLN